MSPTRHRDRIVLHISGADRAGITSRITRAIADEGARLLQLDQSVLQGYLILSLAVEIPPESLALRQLLFVTTEMGLRLEVSGFNPTREATPGGRPAPALCVTAIGPVHEGDAVARLTGFMAEAGYNIGDIRTVSEGDPGGIEIIVELPAEAPPAPAALGELRRKLLTLGREMGLDMAVQMDDIFRRTKRLVCLDVDSTFTRGELIDELAAAVGKGSEVAAITERAMQGELDFRAALEARVALLAGLERQRAEAIAAAIPLSPGAAPFARTLKSLGFRVGLVSGGFDFFVQGLKARCGLDFAFANELEVSGGRLTGRLAGSVVDAERKAQVLKDMAQVYKCRLEQTVAIGDGANDMLMLQAAGLGIAYRARPRVKAVADVSVDVNAELDTLLFLMGFSARELHTLEP